MAVGRARGNRHSPLSLWRSEMTAEGFQQWASFTKKRLEMAWIQEDASLLSRSRIREIVGFKSRMSASFASEATAPVAIMRA